MRMKRFEGEEVKEMYEALKTRTARSNTVISGRVADIIESVRTGGDKAISDLTEKIDGFRPDKLVLNSDDIAKIASAVPRDLYSTLEKAADNIRKYHEKQKNEGYVTGEPGRVLGRIVRPLKSVGVYVPGGTAAYPSTVLMNCVPAKVAGVKNIVIITPPKKEGINPAVAAAAQILGIDKIYTVGGAQAIAALAFGTESIPKVDKVVGPGNIYVAEAKKQLYGTIDIDMIAGPSEVLIVADESANPKFIAADLLSQLEHDKNASAILVTYSKKIADAAESELLRQTKLLSRGDILTGEYCFCAICADKKEMFEIANNVAPEHMEILTENPEKDLSFVENAGSIFVGENTPEPVGDYFAGTNHVLPTNGTARFFSPLSVDAFVKKMSYVNYSRETLKNEAEDIIRFANCEGLDAHAASVKIRFEK